MRVGVYVDAFNLYYGASKTMSGTDQSWKWLDIRKLAARFARWEGATVHRVVYCTAEVNDPEGPDQGDRQRNYLAALQQSGAVDHIEKGRFSSWAKEYPLTLFPVNNKAPIPMYDENNTISLDGQLPLRRDPDGRILATVRSREEKGSDVNVGSHLLVDVLTRQVEAAIIISNDSDLAYPIAIAREHVPVGVLNPSPTPLPNTLKGSASTGNGHWWLRAKASDFTQSQLPEIVGDLRKPSEW